MIAVPKVLDLSHDKEYTVPMEYAHVSEFF